MSFKSLSDMKVGMVVKCVYPLHHRCGQTATILRLSLSSPSIELRWEDGSINRWYQPTSFEPYELSEEDLDRRRREEYADKYL